MTPALCGCRILTAALNNVLRRFSHSGWTRISRLLLNISYKEAAGSNYRQRSNTSDIGRANDPQKLGGMALTSDDGKRNSRVANDDQDGTPNWLPHTEQPTQRSC